MVIVIKKEETNMKNIKELKYVYDCYPFTGLTQWQKFKLWLRVDVIYFFMKIWWKVTKKY